MAFSRFLVVVPGRRMAFAARLHLARENIAPEIVGGISEKLVNFGFEATDIMRLPERSLDRWWEKTQLLTQHGFCAQDVVKIMGNVNRRSWIQLCSTRKLVEALEVARSLKFSNKRIAAISHGYAGILHLDPNTRKRKMEYLETLGIKQPDLEKIITKDPVILASSIAGIQKSVAALRDIGVNDDQIRAIVMRQPSAIRSGAERNARALLEAFEGGEGVSKNLICKMIIRQPRILLCPLKQISEKTEALEHLGLARKSKHLLTAVIEVSITSCKGMQEKITFLLSLGFSRTQVRKMVSSLPTVLRRSKESLSRHVRYGIDVLNLDLEEIVTCPSFLTASLERKIIPRLDHLAKLREKGALQRHYKLSTVLCCSEKTFQQLAARSQKP